MSLVEFEEFADGSGDLLLNRADKMNAFSQQLMGDFETTLSHIEKKISDGNLRVLLVRSAAAPKAFCAGADLKERLAMNESEVAATLARQRSLMDRVAALEVPVIAVIDGIAFGGGLELALCCDLRVGSSNALMGLTETKLAIIPGAGGTQRLTVLVGEARAKEMIFLAQRVDAKRALEIGLLHAMSDAPLEHARTWASEMLGHGPLAMRAAKRAIEAHRSGRFAGQLDTERACYEQVLNSQDRIEGLAAFVEKRSPKYQGQ